MCCFTVSTYTLLLCFRSIGCFTRLVRLVHLSVCPVRASTSKTEREIGVNVPCGRSNLCALILSSKGKGQGLSQEFDLGEYKWVKETKQPHKNI